MITLFVYQCLVVGIDSAWNDDSNTGLIVIVDSGQNLEFGSRFEFGASNSDSMGRFSWDDWQNIDIWLYNYNQSIELDERIPKRH